jgi:hypothetical protein
MQVRAPGGGAAGDLGGHAGACAARRHCHCADPGQRVRQRAPAANSPTSRARPHSAPPRTSPPRPSCPVTPPPPRPTSSRSCATPPTVPMPPARASAARSRARAAATSRAAPRRCACASASARCGAAGVASGRLRGSGPVPLDWPRLLSAVADPHPAPLPAPPTPNPEPQPQEELACTVTAKNQTNATTFETVSGALDACSVTGVAGGDVFPPKGASPARCTRLWALLGGGGALPVARRAARAPPRGRARPPLAEP